MSVVTVQVGQCGNQIGGRMFDLLFKDATIPPQYTSIDTTENIVYKQETLQKYFTETQSGRIEAKAVLIDMERKAITKCKQKASQSGLWCFPDNSEYHQSRGSGNNWSLGYNHHGKASSNSIMDLCRHQVEQCDSFSGFLVLMSLAGGTGSGLGTHVTHALHDCFPEAILINHLVWPYSSGEVIVQNYNTMLTLSHLQQTSDLILSQQNDQVHEICEKLLSIKDVSFEHINDVISHKLASVLQPCYTTNFHNVDILYDLVQSLATHPSYKLASIKNVPHIGEKSMAYTTYVWPALLKHLRQMLIADSAMEQGVNWEVKLPVAASSNWTSGTQSNDSTVRRHSFNKSISNLLILRGKELEQVDTNAFKMKQLYSCKVPSPFNYAEWHQPRVFNHHAKSAALVSNSQTFIRPLNICVEKAWKMFNARAYIHQYERYGLTQNDFVDSFGASEQIIADYARI